MDNGALPVNLFLESTFNAESAVALASSLTTMLQYLFVGNASSRT
jgi:hypothetical protein